MFSSFEDSLNAYNATHALQSLDFYTEIPALKLFMRDLERLCTMANCVVPKSFDAVGGERFELSAAESCKPRDHGPIKESHRSYHFQGASGHGGLISPMGKRSIAPSACGYYSTSRADVPAAGRVVAKGDTTRDCLHIYD